MLLVLLSLQLSEVEDFTRLLLCIKAHYACLRLWAHSGFVLMRQLIVAAPCVCCHRCSRRYSMPVWHQCLLQFHLTELVIKSRTDTTHQIAAVITSELHCVHKAISLAETPSTPPCLCLPFFFPFCLQQSSGFSLVTNSFHFVLIRSMIILSTSCKIHHPQGRLVTDVL